MSIPRENPNQNKDMVIADSVHDTTSLTPPSNGSILNINCIGVIDQERPEKYNNTKVFFSNPVDQRLIMNACNIHVLFCKNKV